MSDLVKRLTEKVEAYVRHLLQERIEAVVGHVKSFDTHLAFKPFAEEPHEIHQDWNLNRHWHLIGFMLCIAEQNGYKVFHASDVRQQGILKNECAEGTNGWKTQFIEQESKKIIDRMVAGENVQLGNPDDNKREVSVTLDGTKLDPEAWKLSKERNCELQVEDHDE